MNRLRNIDRKILALHVFERLGSGNDVLMRKSPIPPRPDEHDRPRFKGRAS